jgi:hypothetical protein
MLAAIPLKNIILNIFPLVPGIINIKVRRRSTLRVQEPFKVKVKFDRVNIRYFETIGYYAIGPGTSPHMVITLRTGIADNIPGDQKIGTKVKFVNDL